MIREFRGEYRFLSNFAPVPAPGVSLDGVWFPTTEHAYQAAKSLDPAYRERVRVARTPGDAKRMGRAVVIRPDWEDVKIDVMRDLLVQKFAYPELRNQLLATGIVGLIEQNTWHDNIWGSCLCSRCDNRGLNLLGILLMQVRGELKFGVQVPFLEEAS